VIPAAFDYVRATSVEDAVRLLATNDDAKLLAGGHSLVPLMRLRLARPALLVDVGRLSELAYIREEDGRFVIGALTRHAQLEDAQMIPALLREAASMIADRQVRHRGTIGGSVAHGDPASDLAACLLALDADLVARGPEGDRTIAARDFFTGLFETALLPTEILTEIRVPRARGTYLKFRTRSHDWATVGVAVARVDWTVNVALSSMGLTPIRAVEVEDALREGAAPAVAVHELERTEPPGDATASSEYRKHLAQVLTRRALERI
jgi:aerobic carbon-monoxide dehydrogenase medium subunit